MPTSKLGAEIQKAVRAEILSTVIASPRFEDYRAVDFVETGAFEALDLAIDQQLKALSAQERKQNTSEITQIKKEISDQQKQLREIATNIKDISNPRGFLEDKIFDIIGNSPTGKAVLAFSPIILAALSSPIVINQIIKFLIQPGGPFDRRLRIIIENNIEQFFSREDQKRRQLGLDQVIFTQNSGFGNAQGRLTTNTLTKKRETGSTEIGLNEIAIGLT